MNMIDEKDKIIGTTDKPKENFLEFFKEVML